MMPEVMSTAFGKDCNISGAARHGKVGIRKTMLFQIIFRKFAAGLQWEHKEDGGHQPLWQNRVVAISHAFDVNVEKERVCLECFVDIFDAVYHNLYRQVAYDESGSNCKPRELSTDI